MKIDLYIIQSLVFIKRDLVTQSDLSSLSPSSLSPTPLIKLSVEPRISECLQAVLGKSRRSCRSQSLQNDRSPLPPLLLLSSSSASTSPLPPPLSSSLLLFEVPHPKPALVSQEESNTRWLQSSPENEIFQPVAKMHSSYHLQYYRLNHPIWMEMMFRKWN